MPEEPKLVKPVHEVAKRPCPFCRATAKPEEILHENPDGFATFVNFGPINPEILFVDTRNHELNYYKMAVARRKGLRKYAEQVLRTLKPSMGEVLMHGVNLSTEGGQTIEHVHYRANFNPFHPVLSPKHHEKLYLPMLALLSEPGLVRSYRADFGKHFEKYYPHIRTLLNTTDVEERRAAREKILELSERFGDLLTELLREGRNLSQFAQRGGLEEYRDFYNANADATQDLLSKATGAERASELIKRLKEVMADRVKRGDPKAYGPILHEIQKHVHPLDVIGHAVFGSKAKGYGAVAYIERSALRKLIEVNPVVPAGWLTDRKYTHQIEVIPKGSAIGIGTQEDLEGLEPHIIHPATILIKGPKVTTEFKAKPIHLRFSRASYSSTTNYERNLCKSFGRAKRCTNSLPYSPPYCSQAASSRAHRLQQLRPRPRQAQRRCPFSSQRLQCGRSRRVLPHPRSRSLPRPSRRMQAFCASREYDW